MKLQGITIHKNKKCNTWYTRYRKDGKQHYLSAKTQQECYNLLKKELKIINKEKIKSDFTLESWYKKWLELFKVGKVKDTTIKVFNSLIKHISKALMTKPLKSIKGIDISNELVNVPGSRTQQKLFEFLKDIFTKANKQGILTENIFDKLEKPKHKKVSGTALTYEEQNILINQCKIEQTGIPFLIAIFQGLRKGEILALKNSDINLKDKTLSINATLTEDNKLTTTKNIYSTRTMPIFEPSFEILSKLKLNDSNDLIFNIKNQNLQKHFKKILKNCGLRENIKIHELRHTFITNCKDLNIPEHIIQSWVGHQIGSNITGTVYTHIRENVSFENAKILDKFYSHSTQKKED